jgi:drug/metabolite transporter (DMT)-like permease
MPVLILLYGSNATQDTLFVLLIMTYMSTVLGLNNFTKAKYRHAVMSPRLFLISAFSNASFLGFIFFTTLSIRNGSPFFNLIIIEAWPIFTAILFPLFAIGRTEKLGMFEYLLAALAIFGVSLVSKESVQNVLSRNVSAESLIYPFVAMLLMGLSSTLKARYVQEAKQRFGLNPFQSFFSMYTQFLPFTLVFLPHAITIEGLSTDSISLALAIAVVNIFSAITFSFGTLRIKRSTDLFIWFFTPIFSIFYFSLIESRLPSSLQLAGVAVIITCNLLASLDTKQRIAYRAGVIALSVTGSICIIVPSSEMKNYYDAITVLGIFSTIILAFLLERTSQRAYLEVELFSKIYLNLLRNGRAGDTILLEKAFASRSELQFKKIIRRIPFNSSTLDTVHDVGMLAGSRRVGIKISNLFSLSVCIVAIGVLCTTSRPEGWQHDLVALAFVPSIFYGLFYIIDLDRQRYQIPYELYSCDNTLRATIPNRLSQATFQQNVWSTILILFLLLTFTLSFWQLYL